MLRVTYFSAWERPRHFENLTESEAKELRNEGRDQQYRVVVTTMNEPEPETF